MMLGREVRIPAELKSGVTGDVDGIMVTLYGEYVNWLRDRMQMAHEIAHSHLKSAARHHKYAYGTRLRHLSYDPGDCAWYLHKWVPGISPKLQMAYVLCLILKKVNGVNYLIRQREGTDRVVHHDKLKKYEGEKKTYG